MKTFPIILAFVLVVSLLLLVPYEVEGESVEEWYVGEEIISDDTTAQQNQPDATGGSGSSVLISGPNATEELWTFIKFNVSVLPSNVRIQDFTLFMFMWRANGIGVNTTIWLATPDADWDEDTLTWNNKPSYTPDTVVYGLKTDWLYEWVEVPLITLSRTWYNSTASNYGIVFDPTDGDDIWYGFLSKDTTGSFKPRVRVVYVTLDVTVVFSYYDTATGLGVPFETFKLFVNQTRQYSNRYGAIQGLTYGVVVEDFFGNELYNQSKVVDSDPFFWDIGLDVKSLKIFNENHNFARIDMKLNGAGTPLSFYIAPWEVTENFLLNGTTYDITFTVFDRNTGQAILTGTLTRTISDASFYILNGTSVFEVQDDVETGNRRLLEILNLVVPGVVVTASNLPFVPAERTGTDPSLVPEAGFVDPFQTLVWETFVNGTGDPIILAGPYDKAVSAGNIDIVSDDLYLSGSWTTLYVNDTKNTTSTADDTAIFSTTASVSYLRLSGQNVTIDTVGGSNVRADRVSEVRWVRAFNWSLDLTRGRYSSSGTVPNDSVVPWRGVFSFWAFPEGVAVALDSVEVRDSDNGNVLLERGRNFAVDGSGIYLELATLSAGSTRTFALSFKVALNLTVEEPFVQVFNDDVTDGVFEGQRYSKVEITVTNPNPGTYKGRIVVNFWFTGEFNRPLDSRSFVILDSASNRLYDFYYDGVNLYILGQTVDSGQALSYTIYFRFEDISNDIGGFIFGVSPIGFLASAVGLVISLTYMHGAKTRREEEEARLGVWISLIFAVAFLGLMVIFGLVL